jgi:hypothetical protein
VKRLQDQDGLENTPVTFECELNKSDLKVEWLFNDKPLNECFPADTFVISSENNKYMLKLAKARLDQQGIFTLAVPGSTLKSKSLLTVDGNIKRNNLYNTSRIKGFKYIFLLQKRQLLLSQSWKTSPLRKRRAFSLSVK